MKRRGVVFEHDVTL